MSSSSSSSSPSSMTLPFEPLFLFRVRLVGLEVDCKRLLKCLVLYGLEEKTAASLKRPRGPLTCRRCRPTEKAGMGLPGDESLRLPLGDELSDALEVLEVLECSLRERETSDENDEDVDLRLYSGLRVTDD